MEFLIDSVDIDEIKRLYEIYPVDGVTCNPSILKTYGKEPYRILKEIRSFVGPKAKLHVQVIGKQALTMIEEAHCIQRMLGKETYIKIPVTVEGLKAIKVLVLEGANVTGTAIYNQMQGYLAAKAGAHYVAPYVNRIDNMGYDGIQVVKDMQDMIIKSDLSTKILAASFKNSRQLVELCAYGIGACTAMPIIYGGFIDVDCTLHAVDVFKHDFEYLCGEGMTMLIIE